jgi:hypothetical protein
LVLVICQRNNPDDIDVFMRVLLSEWVFFRNLIPQESNLINTVMRKVD